MVDQYSSDSLRLLALAVGVIPDVHKVDLLRLTQEQVEVCAMPLDLLSLVVLTNSVREDSKETIRQVQDGCAPALPYKSRLFQRLTINLNIRTCSHTDNSSGSLCCATDVLSPPPVHIPSLHPLVINH